MCEGLVNSAENLLVCCNCLGDASVCHEHELPALSEQLNVLDSLWDTLSQCLLELEDTPDYHAVLVLQVNRKIN